MALQKFLIGPYTSGLEQSVKPWLIANDAFEKLRNGIVLDGMLKNRPGYSQFATGGQGGQPSCQSRIIESITAEATGVNNDAASKTFTTAQAPLREGDFSCTDTNETFTEDGTRNSSGLGILTGSLGGTGTVDYEIGTVVVNFNDGGASGLAITATYNYYPAKPVTALARYLPASGISQLLAFDNERMNRFNTGTNRFDKIAGGTFNGAIDDYFSTANILGYTFTKEASKNVADISQSNPAEVKIANHGYKTGDLILITGVTDMTEINRNAPYRITVDVDGVPKNITAITKANPAQVTVVKHGYSTGDLIQISEVTTMKAINNDGDTQDPYEITKIDDDNFTLNGIDTTSGTYTKYGTGGGKSQDVKNNYYFKLNGINSENFTAYDNAAPSGTAEKVTKRTPDRHMMVFCNNDTAGPTPIQVYDGTNISLLSAEEGYVDPNEARGGALNNARHVLFYAGRVIFLYTNQGAGNVSYTNRLLYGGTGPNRLDFTVSEAGFLDADTEDNIVSWSMVKDDLILFFDNSTWVVKKTGIATAPFRLEQIDNSRNTVAPFGAITYLNKTLSIGPLGIIATDGYSVERADNKINKFTTLDVTQSLFKLVYSGRYDFLRMHLWAYPDTSKASTRNTSVLAADYETNTFSKWDISLTVFGLFREVFGVTWADLTEPWASYTDPWSYFSGQDDAYFLAAGDYYGFVYRFSDEEKDDINVQIVNTTNADPCVVKCRQHYFLEGDIVKIVGVEDGAGDAIDELNNHFIVNNPTTNTFEISWAIDDPDNGITAGTPVDSTAFAVYGSGGIAQKAIDFRAETKQLNPWITEGKKARFAYVDIYLNSSDITDMYVDFYVDDKDTPYRTVYVDFSDTTSRFNRFVRVTANQVANFHKIGLRNHRADQPIEINAMVLAMEPVGSIDRRF